MQDAGDSFAGAAFHCYAGDVADQDKFHDAYPNKDIYFTECTGTFHGDWWSDLKVRVLIAPSWHYSDDFAFVQWYMNNM